MSRMKESFPYDIEGRWYRFFVESNGNIVTITEMDLEVTEEGSYIKFPENFQINDRIYDVHTLPDTATQNLAIDLRLFSDGTQGIQLPNANAFDYGYIYVFGHFNKR